MRLIKYINENEKFPDQAFEQFIKDCNPFLRDWKKTKLNTFLYSGRQNKPYWFIGKVRENRKPKDTPLPVHDSIDNWFLKNIGITVRSSTIFCSSDKGFVQSYGETFAIFPIGKYEIIWSPKVRDLFKIWNKDFSDEYWDKPQEFDTWDMPKEFEKILKTYKKGDLRGALQSGNEVMVYCKEYYAIEYSYFGEFRTKELREEI